MDISTLGKKYNTQLRCISYLEKMRWGKKPVCPFCEEKHITKRKNSIRYHCNSCNRDFSVLAGTIFEETRLELPKWFQLILLMINAKKGISSAQMSRDIGIPYNTTWYAAMRVRCAMIDPELELEGTLEMDEAYIGGKPRKGNVPKNKAVLSEITSKRGRGTKKTSVVGIVERKGNVAVKVMEKLSGRNLLAMLRKYAKEDKSKIVTDGLPAYKAFDEVMQHDVIKHKEAYAKGTKHINTIEGFWSIVKKGIKGQYVVISKKYLPFYMIEFQYKYNQRHLKKDAFDKLMNNAVNMDKCMICYKPVKDPKKIFYKPNPSKK